MKILNFVGRMGAAAVVAVGLFSTGAQAAPITLNFDAEITDVAGSLPVGVGSTGTVSIVYDDAIAPFFSGANFSNWFNMPLEISYDFGAGAETYSTLSGSINASNSSSDVLTLRLFQNVFIKVVIEAALGILGDHPSDFLPDSSIGFEGADSIDMFVTYTGSQNGLSARLTPATGVSEVAEPGMLGLAGLALLGMGVFYRRRNKV